MPRQTSEAAVNAVENRYDLVLIASARTRELMSGHKSKVGNDNAAIVTSLKEIEQGLIGRKYLKRVRDVKGGRDRGTER